MLRIDSTFLHAVASLPAFTEVEVKNEPMLFNCDMAHANQLGGPITRAFLQRIPLDWHEEPLVIDTRVHMLMRGWYPCIPGWHHDDVPRTRSDGQPNYGSGQDRAVHCFGLINGDVCPTAFALGVADFPDIEPGEVYYEKWHPLVEMYCTEGKMQRVSVNTNTVYMFDDRTFHTGTSAKTRGWRWFGRVSRYFDKDGNCIARRNERTNEVRRQVQVYLDNVQAGW
jgi:hypothetical protein